LAGAFYHYALLAVTGPSAKGLVESLLRGTVDGTVNAPFQYRFLVPCVLVWLSDHTSMSIGTATVLLDGAAIAIGASLGVAMLRRTGLGLYALPVLLYSALLILGPILYYKPETMTAFACITAALLALQRRSVAQGWWSGRVLWPSLVIAALVLAGCRTDLLVALGVGFAIRWWQKRDATDRIAALSLAVTGMVAALVLARVYPDAHYPPAVGLVQLSYNFDAFSVTILGFFLAIALGPLIALRGPEPMAAAARAVASERLPILGLVATEVASTVVFGRIDEIRLIFPLGFAIAWVGADLWRALLSSVEIEDSPRSMSLE
jgi:hypothetical protein